MSAAAHRDVQASSFTASRERFDMVLAFLDGIDAAVQSHSQLQNLPVSDWQIPSQDEPEDLQVKGVSAKKMLRQWTYVIRAARRTTAHFRRAAPDSNI